MRTIIIVAALFIISIATAFAQTGKRIRLAATCFSTGEQQSGMTKICYYDCLGSPAAITVNAVSLCPLSIDR